MDSLSSLTVFVHAAECGNFTTAGRRLGISSSTVGKSVARLEQRLGVHLFRRSTRHITLTHEGQLYLSSTRRIFCEIQSAERELAKTKTKPHGPLHVSVPSLPILFTAVIRRFLAAYPDIRLDLDVSDRVVNVIEIRPCRTAEGTGRITNTRVYAP
jgi:DNA-binding transcriptional LysR family regulator